MDDGVTVTAVSTPKEVAFGIMGALVFNNPNAPREVPFGEAELKVWASQGYFLAYIPQGSISSEFDNVSGRKISARMPLQYRNLASIHARGSAHWLVGKFGIEKEGDVQKARFLAHLCIGWNEHPIMRQYYKSSIRSSTILQEGRPEVALSVDFRSVMLHCKPADKALCLIGTARKAIPVTK